MAAKLKKFVTINSFNAKTNVGIGFNVLRKAINRTGSTLDGVGASVHAQKTLQKFQADYLSDHYVKQITIVRKGTKQKNTFFKDFNKRIKRMFAVKKRQKAEDAAEDGIKEGRTQTEKLIRKIGKPIENFMGFFGKTIGRVIKYFVIFGALNWITKHPEKVAKLGRLIFAIGKFGFALTKLGVGAMLTGLTNLVGDYSDKNVVEQGLRKFLGVFQLLGGVAALKTAQYLVMPWKLISDIKGINSIFEKTAETSEEIKASNKARLKGYKDSKTGVIYSEKEYKAMKKSAQRADSKRAARAGKGMKSDLYGREFDKRFQGVYGNKRKTRLDRLQQRGRILRGKGMKGISKFAKANPAKVTGAFSVLGGGLRIASGLAAGEESGQAIGAGIGQAAGGIAGAAAMTAIAPFLGPFAPMIGSAIGGFLGEWVGKTFGKLAQPIFDPIGRYFKMYFKLAMDVSKPFRDNLGPLLGEIFKIIGHLGETIFKQLKPLLDFTGFVLKLAGSALAETVSFVINNAKRLMNPKSVIAGFADALTFNAFDFDGFQREEGKKAWWDPAGVFTGKDGGSSNKKDKAWWDPAGVFTGKANGGALTDKMRQALHKAQFAEGGLVTALDMLLKIAGFDPEARKKEMASGGKILQVPYYNQRANDDDPSGRKGDTQCYSTVMAMWTSYLTKNTVTTKEYNKTRNKYGSSTSASAQEKALRDYGIVSKLETGVRGYDKLKNEIDEGYPVPLGLKYTGTGHWALLTGYTPDGWVLHDPFGQLGYGGNWIKKNAQASKTEGVGKSYHMSRDIFQNQSPENNIWMWKAPRKIDEITKAKASVAEADLSPAEIRKQRFMDSLTQVKDKAVELIQGGIDKVEDWMGIQPTEEVNTKMVKGEQQMTAKAQRDADEEMESDVIVLKQSITQPIINNVGGGQPKFVYINSKSPMLTEFV